MNLVFSVYTKDVFKEYILPSLNNADHTITLRKDEFQIREDIHLKLEVIDQKWKIRSTSEYRIAEGEQVFPERLLRDQQILKIRTTEPIQISAVISEIESIFHAFDKIHLGRIQEISIGRDASNDIVYDSMGMVSRHHTGIIRKGSGYAVENRSPNGSYVNGQKVSTTHQLKFGDYINVVGLHMVFLGDRLALDTGNNRVRINNSKLLDKALIDEKTDLMVGRRIKTSGQTLYHRAPRTFESVSEEPIEIEAPPQLQKQKKQSLMMMIGPSVTMALPMVLGCLLMVYAYSGSSSMMAGRQGLFMYSGLVMAVSSAAVGVVWAIANMRNQQKEEAQDEALRMERYGEYLIEKTNEIRVRYEQTITALEEIYPSPEDCLTYDEVGGMLWNRNRTHKDFLTHRIGLGEIPFPTEIKVPQKRFSLQEDSLAEKAQFIKENYEMMVDAPVTLDLSAHHLIGIIGGPQKKGAIDIARLLSLQIAAGNCYTDVKMGFIFSGETSEDHGQWEFAKWLPHVWSEDRKTRYVASGKTEASDVFYELTTIFRTRTEDKKNQSSDRELPRPYYIIFISDQSMLEGEPFAKYVASLDPACGLTTVLLAETYEQLPNSCDYIIENTKDFCGGYGVYGSEESKKEIAFDSVDSEAIESFARRIARLRVQEIEEGGELPNALTYFEMMDIKKPDDLKVRELWAKNRTYDNIRGQIGIKMGGVPCFLDVHEKYHGPHGLVAGTTGSGKSETLQTYMLSLAINYSPDDIGFFIIDYKGGGMANLFDGLPHMVGQISNLSGNQVRRAMISIKSENRRRQRIFNENGVNNINNYTKLVKNGEAKDPVPHLFIVIDEFAELKREEPDFMRELISVAQVGRSLGVHLILATQKPSGTVDDNIWSNSKFRLCLRVQDRQDSMDMLHKPDAAYITQAGRCYLQVGNDEVYELFQSGYSGAPYDENVDVGNTDIARMITCAGKVEMTGTLLKQSQKKEMELAWILKLLKALQDAVKKTRIDPKAALQDFKNLQRLQQGMYEALHHMKIDYPVSGYNSLRLEDFIRLCADDMEKNEGVVSAERIEKKAEAGEGKLPQAKDRTQLDAIKDHLAGVAADSGYVNHHQLWLPVLKDAIALNEFEEFRKNAFSKEWGWTATELKWNLKFLLGQWDDPVNQSQPPLYYDFAEDGNLAVCGSVVSGKSTTLQTIAYALINRYSPDAVNLYALDFSSKMMSAFEKAPHVGGVMFENDQEKIAKFFNMIQTILNERKTLLRGGSYRQYVQVNGPTLPAIVILIDNYGAFKEKTAEKYEDAMIQLSKEGINHGIFLVVSGGGFGISDITSRVGENLNTVLTLSLKDKFAYGDLLHTMQIDMMPETGIKGRGLALYGKRVLEYQTAIAVRAEDDFQRMEKIRQQCSLMRETWTGKIARPIPEIPAKPDWATFAKLEEYVNLNQSGRYLPVGYNADNAAVYGLPLASTFCYGVYGTRMSGRTNFLKACIMAAMDQESSEIRIIDTPDGILSSFRPYKRVSYCSDEQGIFDLFSQMIPVIQERNGRKKELLEEGCEEDDLFDAMKADFAPIYVMISDFAWFIETVYDSELDMSGAIENILSKGSMLQIFFIGDLALEDRPSVAGYQIFESFTGYRTGIHFGGKTMDNPLLNFDHLAFAQQSKLEKPGVGLLPDRREKTDPWKVIIPLVRSLSRNQSKMV